MRGRAVVSRQRLLLLLLACCCCCYNTKQVLGLQVGAVGRRTVVGHTPRSAPACAAAAVLRAAARDHDEDEEGRGNDRLRSLGYSDDEIQRSRTSTTPARRGASSTIGPAEPEVVEEKAVYRPVVNVNLIPEIDAVTLTALGFALIAFNFFVLANLGDGGVAGLVASLINLSRQ